MSFGTLVSVKSWPMTLSVEHGVGGIAGHLNLSEDPKEPLGGKHGVDLLQRELLLLALVLHPKIQLVVVLKQ